VKFALSNGFTVTVIGDEAGDEHPKDVVVTVKVPALVTLIDCVVWPADQVFPDAAEDVRVTLPPAQNVVGPLGVMVGVAGVGLTVMV
jgi:hypothetical protein